MNPLEMTLLKWAWKRILSKSPEFAKKIRWAAGIATILLGAIMGAITAHYINLPANVSGLIFETAKLLGAGATALWGATWLDTADPALMSPSTKAAVIAEVKTPIDTSNRGNDTAC